MSVAIVTGASGLVGSETVRFLAAQGVAAVGIDNNMRAYFFGADASTDWNADLLLRTVPGYRHVPLDIRDAPAVDALFQEYGASIELVVHAAAQPSHDWAAREPVTDFTINANGTLVLLEAVRKHCPEAAFILTSTNKVYGDRPNSLPFIEMPTRWELDSAHPYSKHGIDEGMSIDQCLHSFLGASKVAADILTQEYGRYFGIRTAVFRGGCLTGGAHAGAELHGFLAYLVKCALTGKPYTVYGYRGKQVRDNVHAADLAAAFWCYFRSPRPGAVYNVGGSRHSNCSMLEAIQQIQEVCGRELQYQLSDEVRAGDHIWWISDVRRLQADYPEWQYRYTLADILAELVAATRERLGATG